MGRTERGRLPKKVIQQIYREIQKQCGKYSISSKTEQWATALSIGEDAVRILFDTPQRAITLGQAAVLYDGDTVLGGRRLKQAYYLICVPLLWYNLCK